MVNRLNKINKMLIGKYYHHLEANGRLSLPAKFREINKEWIVTRGLDGCLFLLQESNFKKELEKRSINSISTRINALQGSTSILATSFLVLEDSFNIDNLENNTLIVYLYEGKYLAMVTFVPGTENIVGASASFVISDSLSQINSETGLIGSKV